MSQAAISNSPGQAAGIERQRAVLLVDDSRVQRRILQTMLSRWGFRVLQAATADDALDLCAVEDVDFIISDWMMPGMTGPEFCARIRAQERKNYVYFILLTSKSETREVVSGLETGADDFLTKPVSGPELKARLQSGERILQMQAQLTEKNGIISNALEELKSLYDAIDRDLAEARKIQLSLVPESTRHFGNSQVSMLLKPCGHVGGDLVGAFSPGPNRLAFYNIDVSGHGVTSALMTARLAGYLSGDYLDTNVAVEQRFERFHALRQPDEVGRLLNERLLSDRGASQYFTMCFAFADLSSGQVRFIQAGHPHPVLQRQDGAVSFLGDGGMPIGLLPEVEFDLYTVQMEPGDRLMFYSDGFTEATDRNGRMLEEEGLKNLLHQCGDQAGPELLNDLFWLLSAQRGDQPLEDDVSAILLEYGGP